MINLDYKDGRTIHEQIESGLKELIIKGVLKCDEQLPSVRELSISLTVNPNTVQRAYKELEQEGFIYSIKGKGNFVAKVSDSDNQKRCGEVYDDFRRNVRELIFLGEDRQELMKIINEIYSEKEGSL